MKKLYILSLICFCSCSASTNTTINNPSVSWQPEGAAFWSQKHLSNGEFITNDIVIGFRSYGIVVWKYGQLKKGSNE